MRSITLDRWPRPIERIELFPAPRGKYSGLLTSQTLNNCILLNVMCFYFYYTRISVYHLVVIPFFSW